MKIKEKELALVQHILGNIVPECEVRAFGSRVNGNPKPFSDLDLALVDVKPVALDIRADLAHAFSESDLPWKVDVVDWLSISPEFQQIIQKNYEVVQTPASIKPNK
ncbi:MAG: nucleotidyltransferase domain-containing protein [Burkholderiales bacterium]|uniref:nucleotidyltransferase family protein n=1 Tax=Limnobacter sp. TaxID=2003368 RepID=UPI003942ACDA|nr:nucleotidyltransferase domain-containing protein [Burkholderiales bacterium]